MFSNRGFFLAIEGLDGSGKTELCRLLVDVLEETFPKKGNIKLTFEPHDPSCGGLFIRQVLAKKRHYDPHTLALAFAANRADHLVRDIIPFLENPNNMVVCDRYYLSSLVYQSTDGIAISDVMTLNAAALQPNLIIFLNASDATCYERMRERNENKELFEANLRKTREKYQAAIEFLRERGDVVHEVMADGKKGEVLANILQVLKEHGPEWLKVQFPLPFDVDEQGSSKAIVFNGGVQFTLSGFVRGLAPTLSPLLVSSKDDLERLRIRINEVVRDLSDKQLASLYHDFIRVLGYRVVGEIPWTETKALDLEYSLPLNITQHGIGLFMNRTQSYSMITKNILDLSSWEIDSELPMTSDFLICFDFSNEHVALDYFERDLIIKKSHTSPAVILMNRRQIRDMLFAMAIALQLDDAPYGASQYLSDRIALAGDLEALGVSDYWQFAVRATSRGETGST